MKIFYKIISFLTVFFFTLNFTSFARENSQKAPQDVQTLNDFTNKSSSAQENESAKKQASTFDFNGVKQKLSYIKSFGVSFLKHIFSAVIDYCVASVLGNLIELKIKNKHNNTDSFWLLRDTCCQC